MIEFEHVAKEFDARRIIADFSLAIPRGEFCVLIGASGSGKSTALRLVNRLIDATAGTIRVDGKDVRAVPIERLRRGIGYVIQSVGLFPHWSVEDNIATVPRLLGWPEAKVSARVIELLSLLRLDPEIGRRRPHQLSGGQAQRVGVARALAADPAILLMDEPFAALDAITRSALQDELAQIHRATGKTILFVTHDIDEALKLAESIAVIDHGRLVQHGSPRTILEAPAGPMVATLLGEDGLRLLAVRTVSDVARPLDGEGKPSGEPIDGAMTLRAALSAMVARRVDCLAVKGADGGITKALRLADIVEAGR
jgi:osmoprotectant transport system ATP-binding protein